MARILIADDDKLIHRIYAKTIDSLGHEVIPCYNGKEALDFVSKEDADLVILDNYMPEMDGYETCQAIRKLPNGLAIPIIVVSADDSQDEILKFLNAGANDYLLKPINETMLIAKLKNFLKTSSLNKNELEMVRNKAVIADRYKIKKVLGYGSHSVVFLAVDQKNKDTEVAVKLLNQNVVTEDLVQPITELALKIQNSDLENVIEILEFGQYGGNFFIVLEYAEGGDFANQLKKQGRLSEAEIIKIGNDIAKALISLKKNDISHLDIKPENIMLHNGIYMLSDFGVISQKSTATMSLNAEIWGTPAYSPPETLMNNENVSEKSDIYSFGVTLYEALVGDNPFIASKPSVSMFRQLNLHPTSLLNMDGKCSVEISVLIDMMLSKQPSQRPSSDELQKTFLYLAECISEAPKTKLTYIDKPEINVEDGAAPKSVEKADEKIEEVVNDFSKATNVEMHTQSWKRAISTTIPSFKIDKYDFKAKILKVAIAIIVFFSIYSATLAVSKLFSEASEQYDFKGIPAVTICEDCGNIEIQPVIDIGGSKCSKCGGHSWYAMRCKKCGKTYPLNEDKLNDNNFNEDDGVDISDKIEKLYACPFCKSTDTEELTCDQFKEESNANKK